MKPSRRSREPHRRQTPPQRREPAQARPPRSLQAARRLGLGLAHRTRPRRPRAHPHARLPRPRRERRPGRCARPRFMMHTSLRPYISRVSCSGSAVTGPCVQSGPTSSARSSASAPIVRPGRAPPAPGSRATRRRPPHVAGRPPGVHSSAVPARWRPSGCPGPRHRIVAARVAPRSGAASSASSAWRNTSHDARRRSSMAFSAASMPNGLRTCSTASPTARSTRSPPNEMHSSVP